MGLARCLVVVVVTFCLAAVTVHAARRSPFRASKGFRSSFRVSSLTQQNNAWKDDYVTIGFHGTCSEAAAKSVAAGIAPQPGGEQNSYGPGFYIASNAARAISQAESSPGGCAKPQVCEIKVATGYAAFKQKMVLDKRLWNAKEKKFLNKFEKGQYAPFVATLMTKHSWSEEPVVLTLADGEPYQIKVSDAVLHKVALLAKCVSKGEEAALSKIHLGASWCRISDNPSKEGWTDETNTGYTLEKKTCTIM